MFIKVSYVRVYRNREYSGYHDEKDITGLHKEHNKSSLQNLLSYNADSWLADRPPELVHLIKSLCGNTCLSFKVAKAIEYLYGCRNSKLVLPLSFQENILIYSLSRSKSLLSYSGKMNPSGSYEYMSNWKNDQAMLPPKFPDGVVRSVFDIGKTYKIKAENKVPMSAITSNIYISIDPKNEIQKEEKYSPNTWLFIYFNFLSPAQENSFMYKDFSYFRMSRNAFIKERLSLRS